MTHKIRITGFEVNMRSGPGLDFNIVGRGRQGEEYDWLMTASDLKDPSFKWFGSAKGWTRSDLSQVVKVSTGQTGSLGGSTLWPRPCAGRITWDYNPPEHLGIDIWADPPTMVYGIVGARVHRVFRCTACGSDPTKQFKLGDFSRERGWGFGNYVVLEKDGIYVVYAHLQYIDDHVVEGQTFREGPLGRMGMSGNANGWHLHLEVRDNPNFDKSMKGIIDPRKVFAL